jgi:hypothetical protein
MPVRFFLLLRLRLQFQADTPSSLRHARLHPPRLSRFSRRFNLFFRRSTRLNRHRTSSPRPPDRRSARREVQGRNGGVCGEVRLQFLFSLSSSFEGELTLTCANRAEKIDEEFKRRKEEKASVYRNWKADDDDVRPLLLPFLVPKNEL